MRRRTLLAMAVALLALGLVGGLAAVRAQTKGKHAPAPPPPPAEFDPAPPPIDRAPTPAEVLPPDPTAPAPTPISPPEVLPPPGPPSPSTPAQPPAQADADPMDAVEAFVQRNKKEAEESIRALSREAESLRNRLQKVETALQRWKAVDHALKQAPGNLEPALLAPVAPANEHEPADLTPAPIETAPRAVPDPTDDPKKP